ncbi:MAG: CAP domain-containing protein [Flavisolibacter sp.]
MKTIIIFFAFIGLSYLAPTPEILPKEGQAAFNLLNDIRKHPKDYISSFPFLKDVQPTYELKWNDTLAQVAESKALDMARRNYFAHVDQDGYGINHYIHKAGYKLEPDWIRKPQQNLFESCNAGAHNGEEAIRMLLTDNGVPSLGHRIHLLGLDSWSSSLVDIGIGFAKADKGNNYISYTCIIIAKHKR